jgi:hypothetical protein
MCQRPPIDGNVSGTPSGIPPWSLCFEGPWPLYTCTTQSLVRLIVNILLWLSLFFICLSLTNHALLILVSYTKINYIPLALQGMCPGKRPGWFSVRMYSDIPKSSGHLRHPVRTCIRDPLDICGRTLSFSSQSVFGKTIRTILSHLIRISLYILQFSFDSSVTLTCKYCIDHSRIITSDSS